MPVLKNARHEKFAQERFKGKTIDEAYVAAGFKENRGNAARLNANESIRKRIDELTANAAEKAEWSAADRLAALKRISDAAERDDPRVAVSAIAEANKMQGSHAPTKSEITGKDGGAIETKDVSARDIVSGKLARLASRSGAGADTGEPDGSAI